MKPRAVTRLFIADDHPVFRRGLRLVLEVEKRLEIAGEAEDGEKALSGILETKPEIAILDIDMPKRNGFEVARVIQDRQIDVEVIFLTMYKEQDMFDEALSLGAMGYVLKENAVSEILTSIRTVASGENYISPQLASFLTVHKRRVSDLRREIPALERLTRTERRVLKLISDGCTSRDIADRLFVSPKTVENHRANISAKLGIRGSHSLLKFAIQHSKDF